MLLFDKQWNMDAVALRPCANLNLEAMARGMVVELCQFWDYLLCSIWKWLPIFFISHSKYYIAVPSIHPPNPYLTSSDLVNHTDFLFIENWLIQKVAISVQWWVEPKKRFSKSESELGWRLASTQNFKPYKKWTPLSMRQKSVLDKTTFWNQMRMM